MEETVNGNRFSDVMLLATLDGSHYKKSQQGLPWIYGSKLRLATNTNQSTFNLHMLLTAINKNLKIDHHGSTIQYRGLQ